MRIPGLLFLLPLSSAACGPPSCDEVEGSSVVHDGTFELGLECWVAEGNISVVEPEEDAAAPWIAVGAAAEGSAQDSVALGSNRFLLTDREPMTLTFRARADAQRSLWVDIRGEESGLRAYWNRVTLEPAWDTYTLQFESNVTADDSVLEFWFGEQAVAAEIDDVVLERG